MKLGLPPICLKKVFLLLYLKHWLFYNTEIYSFCTFVMLRHDLIFPQRIFLMFFVFYVIFAIFNPNVGAVRQFFFSKTQFRKTKACTNWHRLKRKDVQLKNHQLNLDPLNAPLTFPPPAPQLRGRNACLARLYTRWRTGHSHPKNEKKRICDVHEKS